MRYKAYAAIIIILACLSGCIIGDEAAPADDTDDNSGDFIVLSTSEADAQTIAQQAAIIEQYRAEESDPDGNIALLRIYGSLGSEDVGQMRDMLVTLAEDPEYGAIVLWIDTPGGGTGSTGAIYDEIVKARSKKPIVAYSSEMIASGGYFLACGADEIYTSYDCLIGNIGVIYVHIDASRYYSDFGMDVTVISTGSHKDMGADWRALDDEEYAWLRDGVMESYTRFVRVVATARGFTNEEAVAVSDGRIWNPSDALADNMIDGICTLDDAIERAADLAGLENPNVFMEELWEEGSIKVTSYASPLRYQWDATIEELNGP